MLYVDTAKENCKGVERHPEVCLAQRDQNPTLVPSSLEEMVR